MENTIVLTVDYKLNRISWNDHIGYSGGQPFGNNLSSTFDYVYDLLSTQGYNITYNIIYQGLSFKQLTLQDLVSKEEIQEFLNDEIEQEYLGLSDNDLLKRRIDFVIEKLKVMPQFGQPIAKKLIPKVYRDQGVESAYWVELNKKGWRLIYSLTAENEI